MAGFTDFLARKLKTLGPNQWDGLIRAIDARFGVLEEQLGIERRVTESILQRGLQVIEDGIGPSIIAAQEAAAEIAAIADLGMLLTAPSATTVTIGVGTKSFVIPEANRDQFAPAAILLAYAGADYSNAIIGTTSSYNRTTGVVQLLVLDTKGAGTHSEWTLTPVASTADLEALRDQVEADKTDADASATAAINAQDNSLTYLESFRAKYLGASATDPIVDGNGDPLEVGAIYTNTASGKFRYYGPDGWQDTTAGSNILVHEFTTDGRGTGAYTLPEAPAAKENCFVILGGIPQAKSSFEVDGADFSFTADPGSGLAVEVTIIGQLAIGVPSDESVGADQIKDSDKAAIRTKLSVLSIAQVAADIAAAIAGLLNSAPGQLDTLDELSAALGDDANFAATLTAALALKAPLASPPLSGVPTAPTAAPGTNTTQIATTAFVKALGDLRLALAGGSLTGALLLDDTTNVTTAPPLAFDGDPNTGIGHPGADRLAITTAGVQRAEFTAAGVFDLASGQMKFPAVQNPSGDANTIDDVERGTWTPAPYIGGTIFGITISASDGSYQKLGRHVWVDGWVSFGKGAATGTFTIGLFPFAAHASVAPGGFSGYFGYRGGATALGGLLLGPGASDAGVYTTSMVSATHADLSASADIRFGLSYAAAN